MNDAEVSDDADRVRWYEWFMRPSNTRHGRKTEPIGVIAAAQDRQALPEDILAEVKTILSEYTAIPKADMGVDSDFIKDLGLDSFSAMEILVRIERSFGVTLTEVDATGLKSIQDLVAWIARQRSSVT